MRREVAGTVAAQALTLAALALVIGLPLGVAIGRIVWRMFADWQGIPPVPSVESAALVLVAGAVLVATSLIAVVPAMLAAHLTRGRAPRRVGDGQASGTSVSESPRMVVPAPAPTPR